jgi:tetratricopeptide (TPR) repeat protein
LELSRPAEALAAAEQVLAAEADNIDAWFHRGTALGLMDRNEEALASFGKVLALDDQIAEPWLRHGQVLQSLKRPEPALLSYDRAASLCAVAVRRLRGSVRRAPGAGAALPGAYRARRPSRRTPPGPLMKPRADRLTGVDLSSQMLEKAKALGVYDQLVHADIAEHLRTTAQTYDLILATDAFIYIGDLAPIRDDQRKLVQVLFVYLRRH